MTRLVNIHVWVASRRVGDVGIHIDVIVNPCYFLWWQVLLGDLGIRKCKNSISSQLQTSQHRHCHCFSYGTKLAFSTRVFLEAQWGEIAHWCWSSCMSIVLNFNMSCSSSSVSVVDEVKLLTWRIKGADVEYGHHGTFPHCCLLLCWTEWLALLLLVLVLCDWTEGEHLAPAMSHWMRLRHFAEEANVSPLFLYAIR